MLYDISSDDELVASNNLDISDKLLCDAHNQPFLFLL